MRNVLTESKADGDKSGEDMCAVRERVGKAASEAMSKGFVNYFGPQRFGGQGDGARIGRHMLVCSAERERAGALYALSYGYALVYPPPVPINAFYTSCVRSGCTPFLVAALSFAYFIL